MGAQQTKDASPGAGTRGAPIIGSPASVLNNVLSTANSLRDPLNKGSRSPSLKGKFLPGSNIFTEHNGKLNFITDNKKNHHPIDSCCHFTRNRKT